MLLSFQAVGFLAVFAVMVWFPIGYALGRKRAQFSLPLRFEVPWRLLKLLISTGLVLLVACWAAACWIEGGLGVAGLVIGGILAVVIIGLSLTFAGPYLVGEWLGHWVHRRRRLKRVTANPDLLITASDRDRVAEWLARDGELVVTFPAETAEFDDVTFLVRSTDELLHILTHHERSGARAELCAARGEKLVLEHF